MDMLPHHFHLLDSEQIHPQSSVIRPLATALNHHPMQTFSVNQRRSLGG